eukprot:6983190-Prymnesium_polylepis.2
MAYAYGRWTLIWHVYPNLARTGEQPDEAEELPLVGRRGRELRDPALGDGSDDGFGDGCAVGALVFDGGRRRRLITGGAVGSGRRAGGLDGGEGLSPARARRERLRHTVLRDRDRDTGWLDSKEVSVGCKGGVCWMQR